MSLDGGSDETGEWTAQIERANALRAASDPSAIAYIGPYNSGAAKVSLPITNKAGLLQLSPTVTWPGLTLPGWDAGEPEAYYPTGARHFVRMMPQDGAQAQAAAAWAAQLGATTAYVVHDESTYSAGLARSFADAASGYGLRIAGEATFAVVESNSLAGAIEAAGADLLFYAPSSVAQALALMSALDDVDLTAGVIMSDVALDGSVAQAASASATRFRAIFNGIDPMPDTSRWAEFSAAFRGRFGSEPGQFAGNAYDLANLVLDALLEAGAIDRASISRSVMSARFRSGVTGTITLDDSGNREQWRMSGYHAVDGRFVMEQILADTP